MHCLSALFWVDAGNLFSGAFPTAAAAELLAAFVLKQARLGTTIAVSVAGSPRQLRDSRRKWICEEKDVFLSAMADRGVPVAFQMYFSEQPASLQRHFLTLHAFDANAGQREAVDRVAAAGSDL